MHGDRQARLIAHRQAILAGCAGTRVRRLARRLTRRYDLALAPVGLTLSQLMLLLACAGPRPVAVAEVAERLDLDRTTLSRTLAPLARRDLVTLATADDHRTRLVSLTGEGHDRLDDGLALWATVERAVTESLSVETLARLLADLERLAEAGRLR